MQYQGFLAGLTFWGIEKVLRAYKKSGVQKIKQQTDRQVSLFISVGVLPGILTAQVDMLKKMNPPGPSGHLCDRQALHFLQIK